MYRSSMLVVDKTDLTSAELIEIHNQLTFPNPAYENTLRFSKYKPSPNIPKTVSFYYETDEQLILPRNYPLTSNKKIQDKTSVGSPIKVEFNGVLRGYQLDFYSSVNWRKDDLIFACPCGTGKTALGINCIYKFKTKTIVFVNTNFLVRQWTKRVKAFLNKSLYVIDSSKLHKEDMQSHDVILCTLDMFRSLLSRYPDSVNDFITTGKYTGELSFLNDIGLTIFDECHRVGATEYEPVITSIPAKHRIALTATFRRGDGRQTMLKHHFGEMYVMPQIFPFADYYGLNTGVEIGHIIERAAGDKLKITELLDEYEVDYVTHKKYYQVFINWKQIKCIEVEDKNLIKRKYEKQIELLRKPTATTTLDSYLVTNSKRQRVIYSLLDELLDSGRTILVLSKRKSVLKLLYEMYRAKGIETALVISETAGASDEDALEQQMAKSRIIFGIDQLAKEGLDCDSIDTVLTLHVVKDPEQLIGRAMRLKPGKKPALAIQLVDSVPQTLGIYDKSITFAKNSANIKGIVKIETLLKNL